MRLIVFDLDDTLYPEREFVLSGFRAVGRQVEREMGVPGFAAAAEALFRRGVRGTVFNTALEQLGLRATSGLVAQLVEVYREHEPEISMFPDAREVLTRLLASDETKVGVVTDGYLGVQRRKVRALGLEKLIPNELVVCTDEFGREHWKPSPRCFELVRDRAGSVRPECCFYVADNPAKDFIAPKQLGWRTIRVRRSDGEYAKPSDSFPVENQAHVELPSLAGLLNSFPL